jgi:hypothetical protein
VPIGYGFETSGDHCNTASNSQSWQLNIRKASLPSRANCKCNGSGDGCWTVRSDQAGRFGRFCGSLFYGTTVLHHGELGCYSSLQVQSYRSCTLDKCYVLISLPYRHGQWAVGTITTIWSHEVKKYKMRKKRRHCRPVFTYSDISDFFKTKISREKGKRSKLASGGAYCIVALTFIPDHG